MDERPRKQDEEGRVFRVWENELAAESGGKGYPSKGVSPIVGIEEKETIPVPLHGVEKKGEEEGLGRPNM